jgi:hypothetical protein
VCLWGVMAGREVQAGVAQRDAGGKASSTAAPHAATSAHAYTQLDHVSNASPPASTGVMADDATMLYGQDLVQWYIDK